MAATSFRLLLAVVLSLCLLSGETSSAKKIVPVVDPELLSYQFRVQRTLRLENASDGYIRPITYADQSSPALYYVGLHRQGDTLSYIIFRSDLSDGITGNAIRQVNRNVWTFWAVQAADVDSDGGEEVVFGCRVGPDIWIEIVDASGNFDYKRLLVTTEDYNQNGRFETANRYVSTADVNRDGYSELLIGAFSGYDLRPRGIWCLDWKNDSLLWVQHVTGYMAIPPVIVDKGPGAPLTVAAISSMGNDVTEGDMDDRHSYLLLIDANGNRRWVKEVGGMFSWTWADTLDTDDDGTVEILSWTNPSTVQDSNQTSPAGAFFYVYELNGKLVDSMFLEPGVRVKDLALGDLDSDGHNEIIVSTSERTVLTFDRRLKQIDRHEFLAEVDLWKCADFVGNGENQLILTTDDGKMMLLSHDFVLLAQTDALIAFHHCYDFKAEFAEPGRALLMRDKEKTDTYLMFFEKHPFLSIVGVYFAKHQQKFILAFGALLVALLFTNYHRRKIRRNLGVISNQRDSLEHTQDELQKTLSDLKSAQTKLVQSEKMASLGKLVAGIAHEINSPLAAVASSNNTANRIISALRRKISQGGLDQQLATELLKSVEALENTNNAIATGADKVDDIVTKLRSFARLDEAELQKVTVAECLDEAIEMLRPQMKQRVLVNKNYQDIPAIPCYPGHLNQVFLSVMTNAIEAIPERGEITVKTFTADGAAVVQFSDTGIGIARDKLELIFDPGYTTKSRGIGTGMGLATAYQIVRDHKGEIIVDSEMGKGTTVTIKLPMELR